MNITEDFQNLSKLQDTLLNSKYLTGVQFSQRTKSDLGEIAIKHSKSFEEIRIEFDKFLNKESSERIQRLWNGVSSTEEMQSLLQQYAEGAYNRNQSMAKMMVSINHESNTHKWAIQNPEQWKANCMDDAMTSILKGRDTWTRIREVIENNNKPLIDRNLLKIDPFIMEETIKPIIDKLIADSKEKKLKEQLNQVAREYADGKLFDRKRMPSEYEEMGRESGVDPNWLPSQFERIAKEFKMEADEVQEQFWEYLYEELIRIGEQYQLEKRK